MRTTAIALAFLLFVLVPAVASSCQLSGTVLSQGQGLDGATVNLAHQGALVRVSTTDQFGRFTAELDSPLSGPTVVIVFQEANHLDKNLIRPVLGNGGCPYSDIGDISMHERGAPAGSVGGRLSSTLLVSPYQLYGSIEDADWQRLNQNLVFVIGHRVQSFRTSLQVRQLPPELSVRRLDQPLSMVDRQNIRTTGARHLALAVVAGEGELRQTASGQEVFDLSSEINIIARHPSFQERSLRVDDTLPRNEARPTRLSEHLREFWGQKAVIAVIVRELAGLSSSPAERRLLLIRSWLIELRATMARNNPLVREVTQLLDIVQLEIDR